MFQHTDIKQGVDINCYNSDFLNTVVGVVELLWRETLPHSG